MATPTTQFPPLLPRSDLNLTTTDVLIARLILRGLQLRALPRLPEEIAQHILSLAAYRPRTVRHCVAPREYPIDGLWQREAAGPVARVAGLYMTTDPLPRSCRGATRVTLQARGAHVPLCGVWVPDDGGSGRFATYHVRETWLEVCVLRRANDDDDDDDGAVGTVDVGEDSRLESVVTTTFRSLDGAAQDLHERGWDIVSRPIGGWKSPGFVEPDRRNDSSEHLDYKLDWASGIPIETRKSLASGDSDDFLDILGPRDVIAIFAMAKVKNFNTSRLSLPDSSLAIEQEPWVPKVSEAIVEIEYE